MNERDKELARQAWTENDWDGHVDIPKLIQLVRADEREACAQFLERIDLGNLPPDLALYYASLISTLVSGIRARGNV